MGRKTPKASSKSKPEPRDWGGIVEMTVIVLVIALCGAFVTTGAVWLFWDSEHLLVSFATAAVAFVIGGLLGFMAIAGVFNA